MPLEQTLRPAVRATFELLERAGKTTAWTTHDHPLHGYVAPVRGEGGEYEVDTMQRRAITEMLDWLAAHVR